MKINKFKKIASYSVLLCGLITGSTQAKIVQISISVNDKSIPGVSNLTLVHSYLFSTEEKDVCNSGGSSRCDGSAEVRPTPSTDLWWVSSITYQGVTYGPLAKGGKDWEVCNISPIVPNNWASFSVAQLELTPDNRYLTIHYRVDRNPADGGTCENMDSKLQKIVTV